MKLARKLISLVLCLTLLLGIMPLSVLAEIGLPKGDYDGLILEFDSYNAMYEFREDNGGKELGGNMLLVDGTYSDAQRYDTMAHITSVTYNYTVEAASVKDEYATTPNDPLFEEQTYPNSTAVWEGIASVADNYEGVTLKTIRVGVIDSGIDATHDDLKNRVVAGYDAVNETAIAAGVNSDVALDSHGTKVAGLIAAESHNGIGIAGVSGKYPIQLVPLRALNENGNGKIADIIKAIYWAIDNNVDILNMSFGVRLSYYPAALANAVSDAYENGIFMVAAAGNEGNKTFANYYPACLDNVRVAVSAAGPDSNEKAHYSNDAIDKGNGYVGFKYTGVCGTDLLTTTAGNGYDTFTGTSASCAVITGYYAMMLSLTGGRTNPNAYHDLSYVFQRAMAEGALFNYYNAKPDRLRSAILNYLNDDVLFANQNSIKSVLECDSIVVGNTTVTGRIITGAHLVGDASLFVLDEWGSELYRSEPVANDGSNPTEYTFPLSVMDFEDGEVEVQIRFRTKEEVENGFDSGWVANWACKNVKIKNSLVAKDATITLLDRDGSEIYSTVYVVDLATNELVHTIEWGQYYEKFENTIPKSMFNGGKLAFIAYGEGLMYYIESECKEEIVLGGDTAQMTTLNFVGATKTLKNAKIYSNTPAGMFQVGVTDENGVAEILMMEGDFDLLVVDEASRYIVSAHLSQDGDVLEATFADEIDGAEPYTLAVTSRLADNDYYSVGVSTQPVNNLAAAATLGWIPATEPVIYITPGTYYVQVGIYDTVLKKGSISRYFSTVHGIGQVNLPADEIDFDPTVLIATTPVAKYELDYGDKQYITFSLIDDKGYAVYGGNYYYEGDEGTISDISKWEGYEYASTYDADGNEYDSVDVDEDWATGTRDYFFTATGGYETLPAKDATYTVEIEMKNYTFSSDETGMLPYTHQTTTIEFVVKVGKILRASTNEPENYNWVSVDFVYAYIDGEAKLLTRFGEEYNESDDSFTLIYDARKLVDGTPIMVTASGYNRNIGVTLEFYSIVEYDASNPHIVVTPPETGGKLWMTLDGQDIYGLQATIPYGDAVFTFEMDGDNWKAYPVGEYTLSGFASIGGWSYEYDCWLDKYISIDTTITIAEGEPEQPIELFSDDMESIIITPYRQWEFQLSTIDENGVRGPITSVQNGGDTCMVLRTPGSKDVLLSAIPKEWGTKEALGYTVELDFFYSNVELPELEDFTAFEVVADQASFTAEEDVTVSLHTYVSDGLRLCDLFLMKYDGQMGEGGESSPGVVAGHYYPTIRYRQMGGEWSEPVAMDNWKSANLGKLASGSYQACIEFAGVDEYNVPICSQTCSFIVAGEVAAHEVYLDAPKTAGEEVKIGIRGNAGAVVTVTYTTPSGATKALDAITLPANGMGSVTVALTEEGNYTFSARSVLDGNVVNASPVTVACDFGVPEKVENFRATPEGSNALLLTWDVPENTDRVWLYRNGVAMGYIEAEYNSYLDKNLSLGTIYTYSIIPVGANGRSGEATFTTGQPWLEQDTTAPGAPTALTAKSENMDVVLSWTRSTDDVRVVYYYLYRDGEQIAMLVKRSYVDEGLTKNTTYNYTVTAVDAAGNESAPSPVATVTTPANYQLEVEVELERGKTGAVTGEKLTIHADAGRDADKVTAVIEYVSKDESGVQTATIDLKQAGLYWHVDWKIQRVQEIKSIVVHTYEGETEVATKAADGFPCLISSALNFSLTIHNAPYAKKTLAGAKIVLTDTKNGYKYSLPVNTDSETALYEFKGLSAGQYRIQVIWNNKTLYTAKDITVGTSAVTQHSADIDRFVRIKQSVGILMYQFYEGVYDSELVKGQTLTEDGYLAVDGDSAFYIEKELDVIFKSQGTFTYGDELYRSTSTLRETFVYTPGVYEFATPDISAFKKIETQVLYITDTTNAWEVYADHGETMMVYAYTSVGAVMAGFNDSNVAKLLIPKASTVTLNIEGKEFKDASGKILDKMDGYTKTFTLDGANSINLEITPPIYQWKEVEFTSEATLQVPNFGDYNYSNETDITVTISYNEPFVLSKGTGKAKVLLPPIGQTTSRFHCAFALWTKTFDNGNEKEKVTYTIKPNKYIILTVSDNMTVNIQPDFAKTQLQAIDVKLVNKHGFTDWENVKVKISDQHQTKWVDVSADGTLKTTVYSMGNVIWVKPEHPNITFSDVSIPLDSHGEEVEVSITQVSLRLDYATDYLYEILLYESPESLQPSRTMPHADLVKLSAKEVQGNYYLVLAPQIAGLIPGGYAYSSTSYAHWSVRPTFIHQLDMSEFIAGVVPEYDIPSPVKDIRLGRMTDRYGNHIYVRRFNKVTEGEYVDAGFTGKMYGDEVILVPDLLLECGYELDEILAAGEDYYLKIDTRTYDGSVIDYQFDVQYYNVKMQRSDGTQDWGFLVAARDGQVIADFASGGILKVPSGLPGATAVVYGCWYDYSSTNSGRLLINYIGCPGVVSMEVDIHTPCTDTSMLYCDEEPVIRHDLWAHRLETNIQAVILQPNGEYYVKLRQGDDLTMNPCILALPEGAYGIEVDNVPWEDGTDIVYNKDAITTAYNNDAITVSFYLPAAAMEADNTVRLYSTNQKGTRYLQYARALEYDSFSINYNPVASTNEVHFVEPQPYVPAPAGSSVGWSPTGGSGSTAIQGNPSGGSSYVPFLDEAYRVNMFGLQGLYGQTFGTSYVQSGLTSASDNPNENEYNMSVNGFTASERTDKDMTWVEYALSNPQVAFDYVGFIDISAGKWIGFETGVEEFAIGIKVDDLPLIFTRPADVTLGIDYGKLGQGYDKDRGVYWINKALLEFLGMYREEDGQGALFVPMAEPDSYPHTYDIDIDFCYLDSNGVRQYKEFHDEAITIYYNAPVLQKFEYEFLNGIDMDSVTNGVQYNAITSYEDRVAFEEGSKHVLFNAGVYRFKAYFGEPDMTGFDPKELAHVYAAANVNKACTNTHFELFWDEEEGCFVGVGLLGDYSFRPQGFGISYVLAAEQPYGDLPTVQVNDLAANWVHAQVAGAETEGTVEYSAPDNGWTLEYTYQMWDLYRELGEDGELSEADIAALTDENGRLYYPLATFYDKDGNMTGTRQDYLDFTNSVVPEESLQVAVMDGADYLATMTQGLTIHDDYSATFVTTATDSSLILPFILDNDVSANSVGAAINAGKAIVHAAKGAVLTGKIYGAALAANPKVVAAAGVALDHAGVSFVSNAMTAQGGMGMIDSMVNDFTSDMTDHLTTGQTAMYIAAKTLSYGSSIALTAIGFVTPPAVGIALGVLDTYITGKWEEHVFSGFRDLAEMNGWDPNGLLNGMNPNTQADELVDPSGYVFEGYEENRLEGVTATLYFLEEGAGEWVKWNSMFYGEGPNPNITNSEGQYGWDVTYGKWKVVYEKDGYYLSESAVLDVPPPHLDVNIGMVSQNAALLKEVIPGKGGEYVDIVFDRPVLVEDAIAMLNVYFSGETVDGTISALDGGKTSNGIKLGESAPTIDAGENVACTFRFVPDEALEVGTFIHVEAKEGVETYNGMLCAAIVSDYVQVPAQGEEPITSIFYKGDIKTLEIGETLNLFGDLEVVGDLGDIVWTANNPEIATVDENGIVTAVSDGTAIFIATCGDLETAASVVVNPAPHVCVYDQQVPNEEYLATEATEEAAATYYFSCTCGAVGTETFSYGDPLAHTHQYVNWDHNETDHWRVCSCGETATVGNSAHTWVDGVCEQCGAEQTKQELPIRFNGYSVSEDVNGLAFRFTIDVTGMTQKGTTAVYDNAKVMYNGQEYSLVGMGAIVSNDADAELIRESADGVRTTDVFAKYLWNLNEDSASYAVRVINIPENGKDTTVYARAYFVIEVEGEQVVVYADDIAEQTYNGVLNG